MTTFLLWSLRVLWVVLPVALGPALAGALDAHSAAVGLAAEVLSWIGWAIGLVAVLVPRTVSLTAVRVLVALAVSVAVWAALAKGITGEDAIALVVTTLLAVVVLSPRIGEHFVDGSSYGPERRLPLRPPAALLFGPVELTTIAIGAGVAAGPLLLAARQWILGGALLPIGGLIAAAAARSLHGLSRRWLVLVPGGVVVHDPLTLGDPVLLPREELMSVAPATDDTEATDLTQRAAGLAVELRLSKPGQLVVLAPGSSEGELVSTDAVLVTPTRPAELISAVEERF